MQVWKQVVTLTFRKCGICPKKEEVDQWNSSEGRKKHMYTRCHSKSVEMDNSTINIAIIKIVHMQKKKYNLFQPYFRDRLKT